MAITKKQQKPKQRTKGLMFSKLVLLYSCVPCRIVFCILKYFPKSLTINTSVYDKMGHFERLFRSFRIHYH